jgi:hypothetical protein
MIEKAIILSLMITALHVSMCEGMILNRLRIAIGNALDKIKLSVMKKPIYECLICMGGVYSVVLYPILWGFSFEVLPVMLCVIGLNAIVSRLIEERL